MIKKLAGGAAAVGIAVFGGVSANGDDTTRNDNGDIVEAGGVGAFAIQVGDCLRVGESELVESVEGVPCNSPHDSQAFASFDITASTYPSLQALQDEAGQGCYDRFEGFVGTSYEDSALDFTTMYPTVESWDIGDREILCLAVPVTGTISVDAQDSGL